MIAELERSVHKLEQYSCRECIEIAGILWVIPHIILEDVAIKGCVYFIHASLFFTSL